MIKLLKPMLAEFPAARRWVVAYSGGLDSHVLLHLCAMFRSAQGSKSPLLVALHVNHGVQAQADAWAAHCGQVCAALGIPLHVHHANLDVAAGETVSEDALRAARYRLFGEFCAPDDLLLLAHHQDDQAETVLLRLSRGAGVTGLSGMPRSRPCGMARLYRPLLDVPRRILRRHADTHDLNWMDDPSNHSSDFARNFLRSRILPQLDERWPGVAERIARAAQHSAQAAEICEERAREDLLAACGSDRFARDFLRLEAWRALSLPRGVNLLRAWLRRHRASGVDAATLDVLRHEVLDARADAQPQLLLGNVLLRRFNDCLYALDAARVALPVPRPLEIQPGLERDTGGAGRIACVATMVRGARAGAHYEIRFQHDGIALSEPGRPRKSLKKLLQEYAVPPWLRDRVPLLYVDGMLAAVADLCVSAECATGPGEHGVCLEWQPCD